MSGVSRRNGNEAEAWVRRVLWETPGTLMVLDGAPHAAWDLATVSVLGKICFYEVKSARTKGNLKKLTAEEEDFRDLCLTELGPGTHIILRVLRSGGTFTPLPPYPLSFSPESLAALAQGAMRT